MMASFQKRYFMHKVYIKRSNKQNSSLKVCECEYKILSLQSDEEVLICYALAFYPVVFIQQSGR